MGNELVLNIVDGLANGFRAWGATSVLMSIEVSAAFIIMAFRGAAMMSAYDKQFTINPTPGRQLRMFFIALWREGNTTPLKVNAWIIIFMMMFLAIAGMALWFYVSFSPLKNLDPQLRAISVVFWSIISMAGWMFAISTAKRPRGMGVSGAILLVVFMSLSLNLMVS